jgi:cytochrome c peroxidase
MIAFVGGAALAALVVGCSEDRTDADPAVFADMEMLAGSLPASPTNQVAEDPAALALGRRLFFDRRMSADGKVACVSCHDPAKGFSDPRPVSLGVNGRPGARHSMPITAAALQPFLFADGRADSLWSQPLKAIEGASEMDFGRLEVAHFVADAYRDDYETVFGPMPDLQGLPAAGRPGQPAWDALPEGPQAQVEQVFANVGKSIEAYERKLLCADTRFDRWTRGEVTLTATELSGASSFVDNGCAGCHSGPSFSDGKFHNLGIDSGSSAEARGRAAGIPLLLADPFNGAGAYSDDPAAGQRLLLAASTEARTEGAFRTASLRGVGQRQRFGHLGNRDSVRDFITSVYRGRGGGGGGGQGGRGGANAGGLDPLLDGVNANNVEAIVAFLRTLDCPAPSPSLIQP